MIRNHVLLSVLVTLILTPILAGCSTADTQVDPVWASIVLVAPPKECTKAPNTIPKLPIVSMTADDAAHAYKVLRNDDKSVRADYARCQLWATKRQ